MTIGGAEDNPLGKFREFCEEIDWDMRFLSEETRTRIKAMLRQGVEDGYGRGFHAGVRKAETEAAEDAAGESI